MTAMRWRAGLTGSLAMLSAMTCWGFSYPTAGVAKWTAYMMGVDTDAKLAEVKAAVKGRAVRVAIANSDVGSKPNYQHDDYMESEMFQIADYLGLSMQIVRIQPEGRSIKAIYEAAVAAGDIVVDYRSYWDSGTVGQITSVIAANPDKLFILPYGEISPCPSTSASLQGQAQHADGTGLPNLINTIPLAHSYGGRLMRPLRRDAADTSTVTFVSPSAWASGISETCPSAASASVVAACIYATYGNAPPASEILRIMIAGTGLPVPSEAMQFSEADLGALKADLAEMTVTDGLGRKMLLHGNVLNVKGALDVIKAESAGIHARDSFENYAEGADATSMDGWHGDGWVVGEIYAPPVPPGFPMQRVSHTKVLDTDGIAVRTLPADVDVNEKIDVMVCMMRSLTELEIPEDDVQFRVVCDSNGRLCLWHLYQDGCEWKKGWIPLSEASYADGEWIRMGVELDYTNNPSGDAFAKVTINGSCQPTVHGVRSPTDLRAYGPWHYLAKNRLTGGVTLPSEVGFKDAKVDDLMFCSQTVVPEHEGPTSVDGIDFSWFDNAGLPRNPLATAPFVPGYTLGDIYTAGLDPHSDRPLEVTDFRFDTAGRPHIEFNGYKGEEPVGYQMLYSTTPDFKSPVVLQPADGKFNGDAATWTTTWDGKTPVDATNGGFYRLRAVR